MKRRVKRVILWLLTIMMTMSVLSAGALAASGTVTPQNSKTAAQTATLSGWQGRGKDHYYYKGGELAKGWLPYNHEWYYMDPVSGKMKTGWITVEGKTYHLDQDGTLDLGWKKISGNWYCLGYDGAMLTGWIKVSGKYYFLNDSGIMQTGWVKDSDSWYYMDADGVMQTGWLKDRDTWYYLKSNGKMTRSDSVTENGKKYTFNGSGALTQTTSAVSQNSTTSSSAGVEDYTVYVSNSGKIHKRSNCSGIKNYTEMSYSTAKARGYKECKNCY